jgi:hypothetical protein
MARVIKTVDFKQGTREDVALPPQAKDLLSK